MKRKLRSVLLVLVLFINNIFMLNVQAAPAGDSSNSSGHPLDVETKDNSFTVSNPSYKDYKPLESNTYTVFSAFLAPVINDTIYSDIDTLLNAMRELCAMREPTINLTCYCDASDVPEDLNAYIIAHLYDETSDPRQGDYLYWNSSGFTGDGTVKKSNNDNDVWLYTVTLDMSYLSTAAQEADIDEEIAVLLSSNGLIGSKDLKDNYSKVTAIYNYELDNYEYVVGSDNHSTYSAIINNQTVCQGYATAFYRLARTLGLNTRIIASNTHGWNIVKMDDYYYYVDVTWGDNSGYEDDYLLKGSSTFPSTGDHAPREAYTNASFRSVYPISSADYEYNPAETTEEISTNETTELTLEDTTETANKESTEIITTENAETEEAITIEVEDAITTETEETTTEDSTSSSDSIIYESDNIIITKEDFESTTETPYTNDETPTTETWENPSHEDPTYQVDSETTVAQSNTNIPQNTATASTTETVEKIINVNGTVITEELVYEGTEPLTSLKLEGFKGCNIDFINNTGLKDVNNEVNSQSAIQAIKINTSEEVYYAVKTKELGWLDFTKNEMTGVIGMDDYVIGIKFSYDKPELSEYETIITGNCRDYANYRETSLYYTLHTDDDWDGIISNGAINAKGTIVNGIRIGCATPITYKVQQDGKWLREVSNWVLAGDIFSDKPITGLCITGDAIKYRVQFGDGTWSDWCESGKNIENPNDKICDIQIYRK